MNNFTAKEIRDLTLFMNFLANRAENFTLKEYKKHLGIPSGLAIEEKNDASLVTLIDKIIEDYSAKRIRSIFPDHAIIGEEFGSQGNKNARVKWIIDPIDGTLSLITRRPTFTTLIGVIIDEIPVLGLINNPITKERWYCDDQYLYYINKSMGYQSKKLYNADSKGDKGKSSLKSLIIGTTGHQYFEGEKLEALHRLQKATKGMISGGDGYLAGLLANDHLHVFIESGLKLHDIIPLIPIIQKSGGIITDWQGKEIKFDTEKNKGFDIIATSFSSKAVHEEIINLLK